ncbi:MAG: TolC family protein [Spirochaetales bacterium]
MTRIAAALASLLFVLAPAWGEALTLGQAVEAALARGADQAVLDAGLQSAQAAYQQAQARAGFALSTNFQYNASEALNDPARPLVTTGVAKDPLVSGVGSVTKDSVLPQNVVAGVTASLPLTTVTVKGQENFQFAPDGTLNQTTSGSANVTQVLWNGYPGGPLQAALDKAGLTLQIARLNAQANRNKLMLSVRQAFYTLLSAQESMAQLTLTLSQRQESLKFVQAKASLGQATGLDLRTAQINARAAELDRLAGQGALEVAKRRLANLMSRPETEAFTAAQEPDPTVPAATLDDAIALALKNRVEPQVARANAEAAAVDSQLASGATTPSVSLTGGLNYAHDWQTSVTSVVGVLGLSIGLPLIDAGLSNGQLAAASATQTSTHTQEQQSLRAIPVDVTEAWNAWTINQQRTEVASWSVEVAVGQRQIVQAQFDAGLKNLTDLQTSDVTVSTAQFNLLKAKITTQLSALQLQNLLGL